MQSRLADIVQSGNATIILGGLLIGTLGIVFAVAAPRNRRGTALLVGFLYGIPAIGLLVHGSHRYLASRGIRHPFSVKESAISDGATQAVAEPEGAGNPWDGEQNAGPSSSPDHLRSATRSRTEGRLPGDPLPGLRTRIAGRASRRIPSRRYFSTDPAREPGRD